MPLREPQPGQESVALESPATGRQEGASEDPQPRGGRAETSSPEIVASRREKPAEMDPRSGFQPLASLPQDVPRRWRGHWLKLGGQATTSYRAAVELKCLECCAWHRTEARRCEIRGCPLWAVRQRIFGRSGRSETHRKQAHLRISAPEDGDEPAEKGSHGEFFDEEGRR